MTFERSGNILAQPEKLPVPLDVASAQRPMEHKDHDRTLETDFGLFGVADGNTETGDMQVGATAAEAALSGAREYVAKKLVETPKPSEEEGRKIVEDAIYAAHQAVLRETGTVNTADEYVEGGTAALVLALIHETPNSGLRLAYATASDCTLYVRNREYGTTVPLGTDLLAGLEGKAIVSNPVGGWVFGGLEGDSDGIGVLNSGTVPWSADYELIGSSDGGHLDRKVIGQLLKGESTSASAAKRLVDTAAADPENRDDITVLVVRQTTSTV